MSNHGRRADSSTPTSTTGSATSTKLPNVDSWCTPLILPSGGAFIFVDNVTSFLTARVTFKLPCDNPEPIISPDTTGNSTVIGFQEPFYTSVSSQMYALAAATVVSYILVILVFITPRTFFVAGSSIGGGGRFLGRGGNSYGTGSITGVGRRPLLQKIATITVAVSVTVASADTFSIARMQYYEGYLDSDSLVDQVVGSLEIRIVRVISDTFLWLAQVQTLIRLFPRHREKVAIKWLGFILVSCDTIFSILDSFVVGNGGLRPRSFQNAISAMNYLFELAISLIYASCVIYYALSKRRFAFYHPKMRNMFLVAFISIASVLIPVVFFVLDLSQPNVASWGDYIRWVGAAAASVVVWEWVERIEALERDERKDGILGREIFDGDEMLDMATSEDGDWARHESHPTIRGDIVKRPADAVVTRLRKFKTRVPARKRRRIPPGAIENGNVKVLHSEGDQIATHISVPAPTVSQPNRSDTASASTVYAIRYHNGISPSPGVPEDFRIVHDRIEEEPDSQAPEEPSDDDDSMPTEQDKDRTPEVPPVSHQTKPSSNSTAWNVWQIVANPFRRRRTEPPAEVAGAQIASSIRRSPIDHALNIKDRLGSFATAQRDKFGRKDSGLSAGLPVTIIPLSARTGGAELPKESRQNPAIDTARHGSVSTDQSAVAPTAPQNESDEVEVIIVPAPTGNRTWSPKDPYISGARQTPLGANRSSPIDSVRPAFTPQQSIQFFGSPVSDATRGTPRGQGMLPGGEKRWTSAEGRIVASSPTMSRRDGETPASPSNLDPVPETTAPAQIPPREEPSSQHPSQPSTAHEDSRHIPPSNETNNDGPGVT